MAASASLTIQGSKILVPFGQETIGPLTITNPTSGGAVTDIALAPGNNTITVPLIAGGGSFVSCVIIPPAGNTVGLTLKGASGDTGLPMHLTFPQVYSFPSGTLSFIINAVTSVEVEIQWI